MKLRIAVIGPTGAGKTTLRNLVIDELTAHDLKTEVIRLSDPLYYLQNTVYNLCGVSLDAGAQDQILMEEIARQMRRISPRSLIENFHKRLLRSTSEVVLCDDLRDPHVDAPWLVENGFLIWRISSGEAELRERLARPDILTHANQSERELHLIRCDAEFTNDSDIEALRHAVVQKLKLVVE